MGERIAFYGTLRSPELRTRLGLDSSLTPLGTCRLAGTLYGFGRYPGLVVGDGGKPGGHERFVVADLFEVHGQAVFDFLDRYERFEPDDPDGSEYRRVRVDLLDADAQAWVYLYNRDPGDAASIASGDWLAR